MSLFETKTRKKEKTCMTYLPGCGRQSEINQIFLRYFFFKPLKQERVAVIDNQALGKPPKNLWAKNLETENQLLEFSKSKMNVICLV